MSEEKEESSAKDTTHSFFIKEEYIGVDEETAMALQKETYEKNNAAANSVDNKVEPEAILLTTISDHNEHSAAVENAIATNDNTTPLRSTKKENSPSTSTSPTRYQQMYLTKDWWTLWIGLLSFSLALAITYTAYSKPSFEREGKYIVPQPMKWDQDPRDAWDIYGLVGTFALLLAYLLFYLVSLAAMGKLGTISAIEVNKVFGYSKGFGMLCIIAIIAFWIGTQTWCKKNGFGYAIWSIVFGMIIGNSPLVTGSNREQDSDLIKSLKLVAKDGEYFIKCSLVLLAVEFSVLGELGLPAIAVAWVASPITLLSSFLIGRRVFQMDIVLALLIATGATWCGASAISAIAAVVNAPNRDTVTCIGIVAAGTVIFTFLQPYFALLVGMDEIVAGAWIGGSIDQTGNVIASAAIISDEATEVAGIVKIILNSGLGILATFVAFWWQRRQLMLESENDDGDGKKKFSWLFLWDKFPKFVLGYIICSGILTGIVKEGTREGDALQPAVHSMSKWWFAVAFVALGITANLKELYNTSKSTGVIKLYLVANSIDMVLSFVFAWIFFR